MCSEYKGIYKIWSNHFGSQADDAKCAEWYFEI